MAGVYKSNPKEDKPKVTLKKCKNCNQDKQALYQNPTGSAVFCSKTCFNKFYNGVIDSEKYKI